MAHLWNIVVRLAPAYVVYVISGLVLLAADLVVFSLLTRVFGVSTWLAAAGWGVLALAYVVLTVGLASYVTRRLAPRLCPGDWVRRQRVGWLGGVPFAVGALLCAALWLVANLVDNRQLAGGTSPGEAHAAAVFATLGMIAGLLATSVYAAAVPFVRPRR